MIKTNLLVGAAVLSALTLPSLPAQQKSAISGELRQELRELIRAEVRAAVREALRDVHGAPEHDVRRFEAEDIEDAVKNLRRLTEKHHGLMFEILGGEADEHENHEHEHHEHGDHGSDDDDDHHGQGHGNAGKHVVRWHAAPGEAGEVKTFSFPGGHGQLRIERPEGRWEADVEVDVQVEKDQPHVFFTRKGNVLRGRPFGKAHGFTIVRPGDGDEDVEVRVESDGAGRWIQREGRGGNVLFFGRKGRDDHDAEDEDEDDDNDEHDDVEKAPKAQKKVKRIKLIRL